MARWRALKRGSARRPDSRRLIERDRQAMTPLLLFLLGCAVTYLGTVSAAFNALMRLSLRIHAERTDRDDALGRYLEDPRRLFIPARLLISTLTVLAAALLARVTGVDPAGFPVLVLSIIGIVLACEHLIPLLIVRQDPERVLDVLLPSFDVIARVLRPLTYGHAAPRHQPPPPESVRRAHRRARATGAAAGRSRQPRRPRRTAGRPKPCRKGRRASCCATSPTSARRWCAR